MTAYKRNQILSVFFVLILLFVASCSASESNSYSTTQPGSLPSLSNTVKSTSTPVPAPSLVDINAPLISQQMAVLKNEKSSDEQEKAAIDELLKIEDDRVLKELASPVWFSNGNVMMYLAKSLSKKQRASMINILLSNLNDSAARGQAISILGYVGDSSVVAPLIAMLHDSDIGIKTVTATTLGQLGDKRAAAPLIEMLLGIEESEDTSTLFYYSIQALGEIGDTSAVEPLIHYLSSQDSGIRESAVIALGKIGDKRAEGSILEMVEKTKFSEATAQFYIFVIEALGKIGNDGSIKFLTGQLASKDQLIGQIAADALSNVGSKAAANALISELTSKDKNRLGNATQALRSFTNDNAVIALGEALNSKNTNHAQLAEVLSLISRPSASDILYKAMGKGDLKAVAGAYKFFIEQGKEGTEASLISALKKFGSKEMATDYLNCGNDMLKKAAEDWAGNHGYLINPSFSGGNVRWNSAN